ncbi:MAG: hypothetical protein H0T51_08685 [Pirellulales bacterium]|nr:hypothetical protein [Pirellulales bacterium]
MAHSLRLLENWTPEQAARMERNIFVGQHRLNTLDLFNDEQLIHLLDRHPRRDLGINTMGDNPERRSDWQEGRAGNLGAAELLEAARSGRIWLNVRRVMDHHPEYAELVLALYESLEEACPGLDTFNHSANLLISSPGAMVYYHLDCPANMLWHLRGRKRVWAYPLESGLVSDETIEGVLCGERSEELDFRNDWDELAVAHDLEPGEMITWPQHTPHRVVNTEGLNVSLSTEHMTPGAVRRNNVYLANRHFRELLGGSWRRTELTGWRAALKEFTLRVCRRVPGLAPAPPQGYKYPISFEVDLESPNCVRPLDGAHRREPVLS